MEAMRTEGVAGNSAPTKELEFMAVSFKGILYSGV